jgi:hypothetical protein
LDRFGLQSAVEQNPQQALSPVRPLLLLPMPPLPPLPLPLPLPLPPGLT